MPSLAHQSLNCVKAAATAALFCMKASMLRDYAYSCEQCKNIFRGHNDVSCQLFVEQG